MKKPLIFLLIPFCFSGLFAQNDFSVQWGTEFKQSKRFQLNAILGSWNDGIVIQKSLGSSPWSPGYNHTLEYFDADLNLKKSVPLEFRAAGEPMMFSFAFPVRGRMFTFGAVPIPRADLNELYVAEIDPSTLTTKGGFEKIMSVPMVKGRKDNTFEYRFSRDSSHVMLFAPITERRKDPETFQFLVLNDQMEKVWERKVTLPYEAGLFEVEDFVLDQEGTLYLLGTEFKDLRRDKRRGDPNYIYKIFTFHEDKGADEQYEISLEDKFLLEMSIGVRKNHDIICAGFYSKQGTFSVDGTYFLVVDGETKQIRSRQFKEFDIDFITQNMTERQERRTMKKDARGKDQELYKYKLRELVLHSNGGAVLVAEQYYIVVRTYTNPNGSMSSTTYFNYHDIIVVSLGADGEIEWAQKIPKRQISANDGGYYSSYAAFIRPDKLHFIYNEAAINLDRESRFTNYNLGDKRGLVAIASIDSEGNLERRPLMSNVEIEAITVPKLSVQVARNELILYAKRRRTAQFGRVTFEE